MKTVKTLAVVLEVVLAVLMMASPSAAQDRKDGADTDAKASAVKSNAAYQLDFKLSEIENGKRINSRSFSLLAQAGGVLNKLRLESRVPVQIAQNQFQSIDSGMKLDCRLYEQDGALALGVTVDTNSFTHSSPDSPIGYPVVNNLTFDLTTLVNLGKPTILTTVDDPNSKRQFQLEVTATKPK